MPQMPGAFGSRFRLFVFAILDSLLCSNPDMMELMVPLPLSRREQACAEQEAHQLNLLTEMVRVSLSIRKMGSSLSHRIGSLSPPVGYIMSVLVSQVPGSGLRVYKKLLPEMEEFMENHGLDQY